MSEHRQRRNTTRYAESYLKMHSELVLLLDSAEQAQRAVSQNKGMLQAIGNPARAATWSAVAGLNDVIVGTAQPLSVQSARGEKEYFDNEGKGTMETSRR